MRHQKFAVINETDVLPRWLDRETNRLVCSVVVAEFCKPFRCNKRFVSVCGVKHGRRKKENVNV